MYLLLKIGGDYLPKCSSECHTSGPEADKESITFQLHPSTELASIFHADTFDFSTIAETLEANHEYFYKITPFGFVASEGMKSLNILQRNCHTEDELASSSISKMAT